MEVGGLTILTVLARYSLLAVLALKSVKPVLTAFCEHVVFGCVRLSGKQVVPIFVGQPVPVLVGQSE